MFHRSAVIAAVTALLTAPATASVVTAAPATTSSPATPAHPSSVVLDWERISITTIYGDPELGPETPIPVGVLYLGFVSLAMHDAVESAIGRDRTSPQAAAASAAHDVLVKYFKGKASMLDAELADTLAQLPAGPKRARGVRVGRRAADRMIESRARDGRRDPTGIQYDQPEEPGFWQPAGEPPVTMLAPWLGSVDPLVLGRRVRVDGPDDLGSRAYVRDFREVRRLGSMNSPARTPRQTDIARFYNSNSATMVGEGVIDLLKSEPLTLRRTARLFAVMHGAMADAIIRCWELKRDVGFWRPFQAIAGAARDGNPRTKVDTDWVPLVPNPPYSDYVSGHASLTGPAVETLRMMLGEDTGLTLHSYLTDDDRTYETLAPIERHAFHARIWGGLHFRDAMQDGYRMAHETARRVRAALR